MQIFNFIKKLNVIFPKLSIRRLSSSHFVPRHEPAKVEDVKNVENFLRDKSNVLVLTGAGISTESGLFVLTTFLCNMCIKSNFSGIPDYRSEGVGLYARSNSRPVQYLDFIRSKKVRQRYWARNFVAWPKFSNIQPNTSHLALARLERKENISYVVTQNVDRLHTKAGSKRVLELHGCGYKVICLGSHCKYSTERHELQLILNTLNQSLVDLSETMRPDGDIDIAQVRDIMRPF